MFKIENEILSVDLPQGHTMAQLTELAKAEISFLKIQILTLFKLQE